MKAWWALAGLPMKLWTNFWLKVVLFINLDISWRNIDDISYHDFKKPLLKRGKTWPEFVYNTYMNLQKMISFELFCQLHSLCSFKMNFTFNLIRSNWLYPMCTPPPPQKTKHKKQNPKQIELVLSKRTNITRNAPDVFISFSYYRYA